MSTATAAAPAGRVQPGPSRFRRQLALVPAVRTGAPRAPFVVLVGTLLTAGLVGLLMLHTALAEDSFRLHDLKKRSAALADREQALQQLVDLESSPRQLAVRAEGLGMVRSENPAFIRLSDGKILGKPKAGVAPPPPVVPVAAPSGSASPGPAGGAGAARKKSDNKGSTTPAKASSSPSTSPSAARR